jgi:ElaB/YqjD/DUF883 family membrane-anchored ribosome-binding protein
MHLSIVTRTIAENYNEGLVMNFSHVAASSDVVGAQFKELFADVDELIRRVADTENPEIRRIRARVYKTSLVAKRALERASLVAGGHVIDTRKSNALPVSWASQPPAAAQPADPDLALALLVGFGLGLL